MKIIKDKDPILAIQVFGTPKSNDDLFDLISADAVMVRADYMDQGQPLDRLSLTNGFKIFSLKSIAYGGKYEGDLARRHTLLLEALAEYDVIELESETDLTEELLQKIPPQRRSISWFGKVESYGELESIFHKLVLVKAKYYQFIIDPQTISECLWPIQLLTRNKKYNLLAHASGAIGVWSQILSSFIGGYMIYGNLNMGFESDLFMTYDQLKEDYGLPKQRTIKNVFGIAGNPVFTSMSPLIHNKCYEFLEMESIYLPFHIESFDDFWKFISEDFEQSAIGLSLGGFTMVSPFKEESFEAANAHLCPATLSSQACNILVSKGGRWYSDSSDGLGVLAALKSAYVDLAKSKVAIIGCGGAGRTIAARIKLKSGNIVFYNRSSKRGQFASQLLDIPYRPISKFNSSEYDVIINATPVGKSGIKLVFDPSNLKHNSITIDMAYAQNDTLLVTACRKHQKTIIEGKQILLEQVKKQFTGLTGSIMPNEVEILVRNKTENQLKID